MAGEIFYNLDVFVHHVDCDQKPLEGLFIAVRLEQFPTLFLCPPVAPALCPTTSHSVIFDVGMHLLPG